MKKSTNFGAINQILVCTYNVRTLSTDAHLIELENALKTVKYGILGLCEVKRTGQETYEQNGNIIHYIGVNNRRGSVGFIIKSKWRENIQCFKDFSDRVTVVLLKINKNESLAVIQSYAPTSAASDSEVDKFYEDLQKAQDEFNSATWLISMGDLNGKIGTRCDGEEDVMGSFSIGIRARGEIDSFRKIQSTFHRKHDV